MVATPDCGLLTDPDSTGTESLQVEFFGTASGGNFLSEPNGFNVPLKAVWTFGDGGTAENSPVVFHSYSSEDTFEVTLTVEDDDGDNDTRTIFVTALTPDSAIKVQIEVFEIRPVVDTSQSPPVIAGYDVTFDGSIFTKCLVGRLDAQFAWEWDFGDGSDTVFSADGATHRYAAPASSTTYDVNVDVILLNTGGISVDAQTQVTLPPPAVPKR